MRLGATIKKNGVFFRVWAPSRERVEVFLENTGTFHPLQKSGAGYFSGSVSSAKAGMLYRYRLDEKESYPDPCSHFQPRGPFGPSQIIDHTSFKWTDKKWKGLVIKGQVIYELHIGTFTKEGTFEAAAKQLRELKRIGITCLEIMPVADWPGKWNWGYDGVNFFAPARAYGAPDSFKNFVDQAHRLGLGVILDVVYNHFGPDGNFMFQFSPDYKASVPGEWGDETNFDGKNSHGMREFVLQNAAYWISEFHLDGLRFDATQNIHDKSPSYILKEMADAARKAADKRSIILIGENEGQNILLHTRHGLDSLWVDDFHHAARIALTGQREAYLTDYLGTPQEFAAVVKRGYLYQGQYYTWQKHTRGSPTRNVQAPAFIFFLQDHDQVANHFLGRRLDRLSDPDLYRALTALMFLSPCTPMLFMGQEFGSASPFLYFVDHDRKLKKPVTNGRKEFLSQFPSFARPEAQKKIPDPFDPKNFFRSKLNFAERKRNASTYKFHQDLIKLRRDPVLARQDWDNLETAVLNEKSFVLRYFDRENEEDRLVVINLGPAFRYAPMPEPLIAPPCCKNWKLVWSSKKISRFRFWRLPAKTALFFRAVPAKGVMSYE